MVQNVVTVQLQRCPHVQYFDKGRNRDWWNGVKSRMNKFYPVCRLSLERKLQRIRNSSGRVCFGGIEARGVVDVLFCTNPVTAQNHKVYHIGKTGSKFQVVSD